MAKTAKKFTLAELAKLTRTTLVGNPDQCIAGVEALEAASQEDASFLANPRYREAMLHSKAGVICISPAVPPIDGKNFLVSEDPSRTFQQIVEALHLFDNRQSGFKVIHSTAIIHPTAKIAKNATIGPYAVID
jgi:UDP-3-O-[3-hydroxymyristoyl] glucosamine N-acyltransferase